MKRRDLLVVFLTCLIVAGAFVGLYQYRANHAPGTSQQSAPAEETRIDGPNVKLRVTKHFGRETIVEKFLPIQPGDTVMDVLKRSGLELKTGYNGGFVESLGGLASQYRPGDASSKNLDWFYYVNGLMADIGAAEYPVRTGDVVWWDYHDWEYAVSMPALIGAYPHPFQERPEGEAPAPLLVMAAKGFDNQAQQLAKDLQRVRSDEVKTVPWDEEKLTGESSIIVVGDAKSLVASPFIQDLWKGKQNQGLFADLTADSIHALDERGQIAGRYDQAGTGLLLATVHPATRLPIWVVSGTDQGGVQRAIDSLKVTADQPFLFRGYFGVILTGEVSVRLPVAVNTGGTP